MEEKELVVVKSNQLIEAGYRLSVMEQRLILACIGQIDSTEKVVKKDEFKISAREFSELTGTPIKSVYRELKEASDALFERKLTLKSPKTNKTLVTRWVSSVEYDEGEGTVEVCFAQRILPFISQIKSHFTKYKLEHVSKLTSVHAIRIYELCLQYLKIGSRTFTVEELKYCLGLEDEYSEFKDFTKRVLNPAQDQINKHTDIKIKIEPIRKLRKIVSLKFVITSKEKTHHRASLQKTNKVLKEMLQSITH
jgi:plasmid replication initiation protein